MVLVFQLKELPESLQILYQRTKTDERRSFLSEEGLTYIPWDQLHDLPSFVFASFFLGPAVRNDASMKKYRDSVMSTTKYRKPFKRSEVRKNLGFGYSVGERLDQNGHLG